MNVERSILLGPLLFEFTSFDDWVNHAQGRFAASGYSGGRAVCLDQRGRICEMGGDMARARDDAAFPVLVYAKQPRSESEVPK